MEKQVLKDGKLLEVLLELFNELSNKKVKNYLKGGSFLINGVKQTRYDTTVKKGDIITLYKNNKTHKRSPLKIIYEDADFLVVDKPFNLLTIATEKEKEKTAYHMMRKFIKERGKNEKLFILHRLDKDTSGVLVFVKNSDLKYNLQNNWDSLVTLREYKAIVKGHIKPQKNYTCYLEENSMHNVYVSNIRKGKKAITSFEINKENKNYTLLDVYLKTGRKNQIRVILSYLSHPIVGDKKYGDLNKAKRLYLHASKISFTNPENKKRYTFESPLPKEFIDLMKRGEKC